ncbi:hypothetical protein ACFYMI_26160 [Streptomyces collinus]|uniref:hypothetical protein n=1 Tax=Streptomyces collinus TaxID=42684 RepID=UPI0036B5F9D2
MNVTARPAAHLPLMTLVRNHSMAKVSNGSRAAVEPAKSTGLSYDMEPSAAGAIATAKRLRTWLLAYPDDERAQRS